MVKIQALAAAGLVAVLAAGCSGSSSEGGDPAKPSATASAAQPSQPAAATPDPAASNGAAQAGVDPDAPAIASVTAAIGVDGDPKGHIKVEILSLKRKDKLLVMTARVTPTNTLTEPQFLYRVLGNHLWEPSLIDSVNLKQYGTVNSSGGPTKSGAVNVESVSGEPMYLYAIFAAPPAGVPSINVLFSDGVPILNDVPLS
jgi:hypothetical protein